MHVSSFIIPVQYPFDFVSAATAHGWCQLAPMHWDAETETLVRGERLGSGRNILFSMRRLDEGLELTVRHDGEGLTEAERVEISQKTMTMLRLETDFTPFYELYSEMRGSSENILGKGHLLRSPTVFEDFMKTICTTNITWSGTRRMIGNLVDLLGEEIPFSDGARTFPSPEKIAAAPDSVFAACGFGYRAEYIRSSAQQIATGKLDMEAWQDESIPTGELKKRLLGMKGIGPYAASTMLMLLGRYDELAIDSEMKAFVIPRYFPGKSTVSERDIRGVYSGWGQWKYLAYWFDPTPK